MHRLRPTRVTAVTGDRLRRRVSPRMQLNRPDVDGRNFERQTKIADAAAAAAATGGDVDNEEGGGDEGPAPSAELGRAADAGEPRCVAARTGLRLAAAAQLGLAAAAVLCVAPSWPSRSQLGCATVLPTLGATDR